MATYSAGTTVGRHQTGASRNRGRTGAATIDSFPIRQGIGAFRLFQRWHASWHGLCNRDDEPKQKLNQPTQPTSRSIIMLTIKDLAVSKTLDAKAMSTISGGFNANLSKIGEFNQSGILGGKGGPNTQVGVFTPVVTQTNLDINVDASSHATSYGKMMPKWF
jgi:hypothetical protein